MTPNKYQKAALRTESPLPWMKADDNSLRILHGLMGLNGEAGEAIDIFKKHLCILLFFCCSQKDLFQGHALDREHLAKELGDVIWYLALVADALGYSLEKVMQMNLDKLAARYPDGFESEKSQHRVSEDV